MGEQVEVFAAQRREYAERNVYAAAQLRNGNPFLMPLVRTHKPQQQIERQEKRFAVRLSVHVEQGGAYIGRAFVVQHKTGADFNGKHIQNTALLRLLHTVGVEKGGDIRIGTDGGRFADLLLHCGKHLFGIVEIALPDSCNILIGSLQNAVCTTFADIMPTFGRLLQTFVAPFEPVIGKNKRRHGIPASCFENRAAEPQTIRMVQQGAATQNSFLFPPCLSKPMPSEAGMFQTASHQTP